MGVARPFLAMEGLRGLVDVLRAPVGQVPARLSALLNGYLAHSALLMLAADANGGQREGTGDGRFVTGVSFLELDRLRRTVLQPGEYRRGVLMVEGKPRTTFESLSRNGALLLLGDPGADESDGLVDQLWNVVAIRMQRIADAAFPAYLEFARASSGVRLEALTELSDEYSTTLQSVLAALRSRGLDDRAARQAATDIAARGLVQLRSAGDEVRTFSEEPVTTAFERLRADLAPLVEYRDIVVQFVAPPVDGRPLPSEVAHGARAVVRGAILAMIAMPEVRRVRVQWDCDGTNLLINLRDDGVGEVTETAPELHLIRRRVLALSGRIRVDTTPGWGVEMSIAIPLDPPRVLAPVGWGLSPREAEVLDQMIAGRRNRAIAADLQVSEHTVKFHVSQILRKLGVASRAEAVAAALAARTPPSG